MTKPALMRPKAFELVGGLVVVTLLAGLVLSRSGPRSSSAEAPEQTEVRAPVAYQAVPMGIRRATDGARDAKPDAEAHADASSGKRDSG